jgi:hypothetical protein
METREWSERHRKQDCDKQSYRGGDANAPVKDQRQQQFNESVHTYRLPQSSRCSTSDHGRLASSRAATWPSAASNTAKQQQLHLVLVRLPPEPCLPSTRSGLSALAARGSRLAALHAVAQLAGVVKCQTLAMAVPAAEPWKLTVYVVLF